MQNDVLSIDFLRKDDAILVVTCDAWSVTAIALGLEEILCRDQADTRTGW